MRYLQKLWFKRVPALQHSSEHATLITVIIGWIYLSSIYYSPTLFSANFTSPYTAYVPHKAAKYIAAAILCVFLARSLEYYRIFILSGVLALFGLTVVFVNSAITSTAVTLLANASFAGFLLVIASSDRNSWRITRAIIWSGAIVGLGSIVEMALFQETMAEYLKHAGRPRSISTLLNPNNLGVYQGACLLLWGYFFIQGRVSLIPGVLIVFALVASGSRTAFLSLLVACVAASLWDRSLFIAIWRRRWQCCAALLMIMISSAMAFILVGSAANNPYIKHTQPIQQVQSESLSDQSLDLGSSGHVDQGSSQYEETKPPAAKIADLTTLHHRLDLLTQYLPLVDISTLAPDFREKRSQVIHDNAYLSMLNSHGALLLVLLCWAWRRRPIFSTSIPADDLRAYRHVTIFYLISGLSNSFINSFPNSQLFFIAAGVWLVSSRTQPPSSTPARI